MKPMSEAHFAILRRHMVEVIEIQVELASEELGKAALGLTAIGHFELEPRPKRDATCWRCIRQLPNAMRGTGVESYNHPRAVA